jgi:hypothetical protein
MHGEEDKRSCSCYHEARTSFAPITTGGVCGMYLYRQILINRPIATGLICVALNTRAGANPGQSRGPRFPPQFDSGMESNGKFHWDGPKPYESPKRFAICEVKVRSLCVGRQTGEGKEPQPLERLTLRNRQDC